jgi:hypothetical protein
MAVFRAPWGKFPALTVHAAIAAVHAHTAFAAANAGDAIAAADLVAEFFRPAQLPNLNRQKIDYIVPVIRTSPANTVSAVPVALAKATASALGAEVHTGIKQSSRFPASSPTSITRLTNQPVYVGNSPKGTCLVVSDLVAYGSSVANLRGYLHHHGCTVALATSLCAEFTAARIAPDPFTIRAINQRFGSQIAIIQEKLGFTSDFLTNREALFIYGLPNLDPLRDPAVPTHYSFGPAT